MANYLLFLLLIIYSVNSELVSVIQIMRHGARAPLFFNELLKDYFKKYGIGELTNKGYNMAVDKGSTMREKYGIMNITAISTPVQRTMKTAHGFFNGYYRSSKLDYIEIGTGKNIDNNFETSSRLRKHEITVNVIPNESLHFYKDYCIVKIEHEHNINEWETVEKIEKYFPGIRELYCKTIVGECFNTSRKKLDYLHKLYGFFEILRVYNLNEIDSDLVNIANRYTLLDVYDISDEDVMREGSMFTRMLRDFIKGDCDKNYNDLKTNSDKYEETVLEFLSLINCQEYVTVFSHDINLIYLMRNIFHTKKLIKMLKSKDEYNENEYLFWWPQVMSDITFEIHKLNNDTYIKIFYNGKELKDIEYREGIQYTKDGIKLEEFLHMLEKRIHHNPLYNC
jgi:hypothetical protein